MLDQANGMFGTRLFYCIRRFFIHIWWRKKCDLCYSMGRYFFMDQQINVTLWAAPPKGWCPVGHGEMSICLSVSLSIYLSTCQFSLSVNLFISHTVEWSLLALQIALPTKWAPKNIGYFVATEALYWVKKALSLSSHPLPPLPPPYLDLAVGIYRPITRPRLIENPLKLCLAATFTGRKIWRN